jgi:hypothetical protein
MMLLFGPRGRRPLLNLTALQTKLNLPFLPSFRDQDFHRAPHRASEMEVRSSRRRKSLSTAHDATAHHSLPEPETHYSGPEAHNVGFFADPILTDLLTASVLPYWLTNVRWRTGSAATAVLTFGDKLLTIIVRVVVSRLCLGS